MGATAGLIALRGQLLGSASGEYDAGGTYVPFETAHPAEWAIHRGFRGLNRRLTQTGVTGSRSFQTRIGDLTVGDEVAPGTSSSPPTAAACASMARSTPAAQVGSIRLAAMNDLVLNGLLDAHGTLLRVDSAGAIIDSPNRAVIDLTSRKGRLILAAGAEMDLRAGTAAPAGTALATPRPSVERLPHRRQRCRLGRAGRARIAGAMRVAVNAFDYATYIDAPAAGVPMSTAGDPSRSPRPISIVSTGTIRHMNGALNNAALSPACRPGTVPSSSRRGNQQRDGRRRPDDQRGPGPVRLSLWSGRGSVQPGPAWHGRARRLLIRARAISMSTAASTTVSHRPEHG